MAADTTLACALCVCAVVTLALLWPVVRRQPLACRVAKVLKQQQRGAQRWRQRHSYSWLQSIGSQIGLVLHEPIQAAAQRKSREEAPPESPAARRVCLPLVVSPNFYDQVVYGGYVGRTRLAGIGIKVWSDEAEQSDEHFNKVAAAVTDALHTATTRALSTAIEKERSPALASKALRKPHMQASGNGDCGGMHASGGTCGSYNARQLLLLQSVVVRGCVQLIGCVYSLAKQEDAPKQPDEQEGQGEQQQHQQEPQRQQQQPQPQLQHITNGYADVQPAEAMQQQLQQLQAANDPEAAAAAAAAAAASTQQQEQLMLRAASWRLEPQDVARQVYDTLLGSSSGSADAAASDAPASAHSSQGLDAAAAPETVHSERGDTAALVQLLAPTATGAEPDAAASFFLGPKAPTLHPAPSATPGAEPAPLEAAAAAAAAGAPGPPGASAAAAGAGRSRNPMTDSASSAAAAAGSSRGSLLDCAAAADPFAVSDPFAVGPQRRRNLLGMSGDSDASLTIDCAFSGPFSGSGQLSSGAHGAVNASPQHQDSFSGDGASQPVAEGRQQQQQQQGTTGPWRLPSPFSSTQPLFEGFASSGEDEQQPQQQPEQQQVQQQQGTTGPWKLPSPFSGAQPAMAASSSAGPSAAVEQQQHQQGTTGPWKLPSPFSSNVPWDDSAADDSASDPEQQPAVQQQAQQGTTGPWKLPSPFSSTVPWDDAAASDTAESQQQQQQQQGTTGPWKLPSPFGSAPPFKIAMPADAHPASDDLSSHGPWQEASQEQQTQVQPVQQTQVQPELQGTTGPWKLPSPFSSVQPAAVPLSSDALAAKTREEQQDEQLPEKLDQLPSPFGGALMAPKLSSSARAEHKQQQRQEQEELLKLLQQQQGSEAQPAEQQPEQQQGEVQQPAATTGPWKLPSPFGAAQPFADEPPAETATQEGQQQQKQQQGQVGTTGPWKLPSPFGAAQPFSDDEPAADSTAQQQQQQPPTATTGPWKLPSPFGAAPPFADEPEPAAEAAAPEPLQEQQQAQTGATGPWKLPSPFGAAQPFSDEPEPAADSTAQQQQQQQQAPTGTTGPWKLPSPFGAAQPFADEPAPEALAPEQQQQLQGVGTTGPWRLPSPFCDMPPFQDSHVPEQAAYLPTAPSSTYLQQQQQQQEQQQQPPWRGAISSQASGASQGSSFSGQILNRSASNASAGSSGSGVASGRPPRPQRMSSMAPQAALLQARAQAAEQADELHKRAQAVRSTSYTPTPPARTPPRVHVSFDGASAMMGSSGSALLGAQSLLPPAVAPEAAAAAAGAAAAGGPMAPAVQQALPAAAAAAQQGPGPSAGPLAPVQLSCLTVYPPALTEGVPTEARMYVIGLGAGCPSGAAYRVVAFQGSGAVADVTGVCGPDAAVRIPLPGLLKGVVQLALLVGNDAAVALVQPMLVLPAPCAAEVVMLWSSLLLASLRSTPNQLQQQQLQQQQQQQQQQVLNSSTNSTGGIVGPMAAPWQLSVQIGGQVQVLEVSPQQVAAAWQGQFVPLVTDIAYLLASHFHRAALIVAPTPAVGVVVGDAAVAAAAAVAASSPVAERPEFRALVTPIVQFLASNACWATLQFVTDSLYGAGASAKALYSSGAGSARVSNAGSPPAQAPTQQAGTMAQAAPQPESATAAAQGATAAAQGATAAAQGADAASQAAIPTATEAPQATPAAGVDGIMRRQESPPPEVLAALGIAWRAVKAAVRRRVASAVGALRRVLLLVMLFVTGRAMGRDAAAGGVAGVQAGGSPGRAHGVDGVDGEAWPHQMHQTAGGGSPTSSSSSSVRFRGHAV